MIEGIGAHIVSLCSSIVPFYLAEAEVESYPYAVYTMSTSEYWTKDEIYKITGDVTIHIYAKDFDTADTKAGLIKAALSGDSSTSFANVLRSQSKNCSEDVWDIELTYYFRQTN